MFKLPVRLQHGVGIYRQLFNGIFDSWQLVTNTQVANAKGLFDLTHDLEITRNSRRAIESKSNWRRCLRLCIF